MKNIFAFNSVLVQFLWREKGVTDCSEYSLYRKTAGNVFPAVFPARPKAYSDIKLSFFLHSLWNIPGRGALAVTSLPA